jgi:ABC-type transport system involved in multi-copper enzyme maturation permease subunit
MNASLVRMKKEARAIFWPWCAVMAAGALQLFSDPSGFRLLGLPVLAAVAPMGFFVGIPLLATLSFGNEFQHRTLPILLSQPVNRMQIWREKLVVTAFAVASAALIFFYGRPPELRQEQLAAASLYVIAMTAGAAFWTLVARSTIGGLALGWLIFGAFELGGAFLDIFFSGSIYLTAGRFLEGKLSPDQTTAILSYLSLAALAYAGLMLWLSARKLARFQATGGLPGDDLVLSGSKLVPEAFAGWFRYTSAEPYWNLVRKEFRLLQPLWLMGVLLFLYMTCLAVFRLFPDTADQAPRGQLPLRAALMIPVVVLTPVMAILAGCLSLGEERTSGTHSWHMTLPVSARRQWFIKLLVCLFSGFVCAALLPILVLFTHGAISGAAFRPMDAAVVMLVAAVVTLASFWCASATSGTVRAALWVSPVLGALGLTFYYGGKVAIELIHFVTSRIDLFVNFGFTNTLSNFRLFSLFKNETLLALFLLSPALLAAVLQSYRLFRAQVRESALFVIRSVLPITLVTFLWGFFLGAFISVVIEARGQMWNLFRETHEAIEKIQPGTAKLESEGPLQLTVEDLAKASPLSERTRRWLENSRITVAPDKPGSSSSSCCGTNSKGIRFVPDKAYSWYLATIHRPGGSVCTVSFQAGRGFGILGGVCE